MTTLIIDIELKIILIPPYDPIGFEDNSKSKTILLNNTILKTNKISIIQIKDYNFIVENIKFILDKNKYIISCTFTTTSEEIYEKCIKEIEEFKKNFKGF